MSSAQKTVVSKTASTKRSGKKEVSLADNMSSASIEADIAAFLAKGQQIEEVPQGVSGMPDRPSKHIVISRK